MKISLKQIYIANEAII